MLCRTELLYWPEIPRAGGDLRTVLPEGERGSADLDLDERDPWAHMTHGVVLWRMRRHGEAGRSIRPRGAQPELRPRSRPFWYAARHPTGTRGRRCERPACAEVEPERSACQRLRLISHGGCSFRRRALCGLRGPRAGHSRYPPRPWPFTTFSSRRRRCRGIGQRRAAALTSLLRLEPDFSLKWLSENMA
jgi:hypothetical protein